MISLCDFLNKYFTYLHPPEEYKFIILCYLKKFLQFFIPFSASLGFVHPSNSETFLVWEITIKICNKSTKYRKSRKHYDIISSQHEDNVQEKIEMPWSVNWYPSSVNSCAKVNSVWLLERFLGAFFLAKWKRKLLYVSVCWFPASDVNDTLFLLQNLILLKIFFNPIFGQRRRFSGSVRSFLRFPVGWFRLFFFFE